MATRKAMNAMGNLPVKSVQAFEGTLTRYTTAVSPRGGVVEGAAVYSAPIAKGDFVKLKDHTDQDVVLVEVIAVDDEQVHGVAVASPQGIDNTTASGDTPAAALRRLVDVAFFGIGIMEMTVSATAVVAPGDVIGFDANEINEVETQIAYAAVANGNQGLNVALSYSAAGSHVFVLLGAAMFMGN
jgi:hypothetical protein